MFPASSDVRVIDQEVQLTQEIPELGLRCGAVGKICSTWFAPAIAYEVEFEHVGLGHAVRTLLLDTQINPSSSN
jgi:hypothetical protein